MYKYNLGFKKSLVNIRQLFAIMWWWQLRVSRGGGGVGGGSGSGNDCDGGGRVGSGSSGGDGSDSCGWLSLLFIVVNILFYCSRYIILL